MLIDWIYRLPPGFVGFSKVLTSAYSPTPFGGRVLPCPDGVCGSDSGPRTASGT